MTKGAVGCFPKGYDKDHHCLSGLGLAESLKSTGASARAQEQVLSLPVLGELDLGTS